VFLEVEHIEKEGLLVSVPSYSAPRSVIAADHNMCMYDYIRWMLPGVDDEITPSCVAPSPMNNDTSTSADDVSEDDHLLVLAPDARADDWVAIRQAARAEDALYEVRCLWLAWTPQYRAMRGTWTSGDLQLGER
jgi:hypothetical protein